MKRLLGARYSTITLVIDDLVRRFSDVLVGGHIAPTVQTRALRLGPAR